MTEDERNEFVGLLKRTEQMVLKQGRITVAADEQCDVARENYEAANDFLCKLRRTVAALKSILEAPPQEPNPQEDLPLAQS